MVSLTPGLLALAIGIVAGSRSMLAPAAAAWAARLALLQVAGTPLAWLAHPWTAWILTLLASAELVGDQLPSTPSRTVPPQFAFRIVSGALSGWAFTASTPLLGITAGIVGAVFGTLGGRALRSRLAAAFHRDPPAALIEDALAIAGAVAVVAGTR